MLTLFTIPKSFRGHIKVIQTNAIQSWTLIQPACEITLFGNDEGTAEIAARFGIQHVPDVERNEYGTPLVNSLFNAAQKLATHDYMAYVNADIILMSDFVNAIQQIQKQPSLIIGRRWDLNVEEPLDFGDPDWEERLRARLAKEGKLHGLSGMDYFVFPRGLYCDILPFAIGRTAWDNWLVYKARSLKLPVIDATQVVTIVHQNHGYDHITAVKEYEGQVDRKGIESERNRELLGGIHHAYKLLDATHHLTPTGLKSTMTMSLRYLVHWILRLPEMHPYWIPLVQIIKVLRYLHSSLRSRTAMIKQSIRLV